MTPNARPRHHAHQRPRPESNRIVKERIVWRPCGPFSNHRLSVAPWVGALVVPSNTPRRRPHLPSLPFPRRAQSSGGGPDLRLSPPCCGGASDFDLSATCMTRWLRVGGRRVWQGGLELEGVDMHRPSSGLMRTKTEPEIQHPLALRRCPTPGYEPLTPRRDAAVAVPRREEPVVSAVRARRSSPRPRLSARG